MTLELPSGLTLRPLVAEDAAVVFAAVEANREHLARWLPWVEVSHAVADTRGFLELVERHRVEGLSEVWGLYLEGVYCGTIGLHDINMTNRNLQVGYWITEACQGRGLMTEACRAVVGHAFGVLAMERAEIRCAVGNDRSAAIPLRLGFQLEGVMRRAQKLGSRFVDLRLFSMLAEEWRALSRR